MSAPPPGHNEQASNLPDPGPNAAPIHMMRGGGAVPSATTQVGGFEKDDEQIFEDFGLNDPKITQHISNFDDSFKEAFLTQFRSGKCSSKEMSVTRKDCWAVTTAIRAVILANFAQGRSIALPGMVPEDSSEDASIELPENVLRIANAEEEYGELAPCIRNKSIVDTTGETIAETRASHDMEEVINWIGELPTKSIQKEAIILYMSETIEPAIFSEYKTYINQAREQAISENKNSAAIRELLIAKHQQFVADHSLRQKLNTELAAQEKYEAEQSPPLDRMSTPGNTAAGTGLSPSNVEIQVGPATNAAAAATAAIAPAATTATTAADTASGSTVMKPEFEEMGLTSDFRKGQYGINLNANNSQRFYANALVGTKRMRIRGRNAANIKGKYNSKMKTLKNAAAAASAAAEQARKTALEATGARKAAEAARKAEDAKRKAAEQARKVEAKTAQSASRAANMTAIQAKRAAGEKVSFMNRLRSIKNPFKRGGSRKTRRSTRRTRRR